MGLLDILRGNASAADKESVQKELEPILVQGENVQQAFAFIRDQIIFTNKRMILVDKQGMTGSKVQWQSVPYSKITRFAAESAGFLDTEAELRLWIGNAEEPLKIEISKGVPIQQLYQVLSQHILE